MRLSNKRLLVTGAGGFIGSHLVKKLVETGAKVTAFVRYNSKNNWGWLESSPYLELISVYTGDIRDYDSVKKAMQGIDVVFHLAALIGIPYSYVSPLAYIKTNIEGTYNILQAGKELSIERIIHTSTSEVYGTARYVPIDETHPLQPQSPYSASKISADNLAFSYYNSLNLPVSIARPFNTYGPRQSARAIIPTIITQILSGRKTITLGNLTPTRDFNYVQDTVNGFIKLAECDEAVGKVVNIGSGREVSIRDLVLMISTILNSPVEIETDEERVRPENSEVERLLCDNGEMKRLTGWRPEFTLETGLTETVKWLTNHLNLYKPEIYNV